MKDGVMTTFTKGQKKDNFTTIWFDSNVPEETKLTRSFEKTPFVPSTRAHREKNDAKKFWQFSRMDLPNACAIPAANMP